MCANPTVFITGASQGIGRELAIGFAESGANVGLAARSETIHQLATDIGDENQALAVQTDVTDEADVEHAIEAVVEAFGGLDTIVNNAGIAGPTAPVEAIETEAWERTMDVNVRGQFLTVKHGVAHLRESERASILNISSISGKRPLVNRTPYTASKMAVIGLTRTLAHELGDDDITVNAICPGPIEGKRINDVIQAQAEDMDISFEEARRRVFTDDAALEKLGRAADIVDTALFLASEQARHITAQDINVDGGTTWY